MFALEDLGSRQTPAQAHCSSERVLDFPSGSGLGCSRPTTSFKLSNAHRVRFLPFGDALTFSGLSVSFIPCSITCGDIGETVLV
jgi:hypothetical protein